MRTYIQLSIDYDIFEVEIGCHVAGAIVHVSLCSLGHIVDVIVGWMNTLDVSPAI